ncbi:MAG: FAD-dependent oxidoreductase [Candidatus Dormibacteria bacterium]
MSEELKFEAVVIGAGPAGTSAAITMAKGGMEVALLEKGEFPGAKNVMGGILYRHNLEEVIGDAWKDAPVERPIIEEQRWLMTDDAAVRLLGFKNLKHRDKPNSFSVLRAKFDRWYAEQAEKAGVMVVPETLVTDLIREPSGRVTGVRTARDEGDIYADVVVVCEGANPMISEAAGLRPPRLGVAPIPAGKRAGSFGVPHMAMAMKEIIKLDPSMIEQRFNCSPGEGASIECFGASTGYNAGFMFIYTNQDTLSVGGGILLGDFNRLVDQGRATTPYDLLDQFKAHPAIQPLLEGGEVLEYSAKMIPEMGFGGIPQMYGDGWMICGDAAMLSNPVHREGSNLAMASGRMAGEAALEAKAKGGFGAPNLAAYQRRLSESWIWSDMRKYDQAVPLLERHPALLDKYPDMLIEALDTFFSVNGVSKQQKQKDILRLFRKKGGVRFLLDQVAAAKAMKFLPGQRA